MPARAALQQALKELQVQERSIQKQIVALEKALDALTKQERQSPSRRPRRPMSSAERRSVSARMKRYWAARRAAGKSST